MGSSNGAKMGRVLAGGVVAWFVLSFPVCLWDALFVLLRPRTMPGGDLAWFWGPYETYIAVDRRYQDLNDGFNIAQAWMNLFEIAVGLVALFLHFRGRQSAHLFAFSSQLMCFAKTVIYFLSDHVTGWAYTKHNDLQSFWLLFAIPSGVWLVFSLWTVIVEGRYLAKALNRVPAGDRKQKHTKKK